MSNWTARLMNALEAVELHPVAQPNGTVTVTANDIPWTLTPMPHAVTGEECGVWSAVGPVGSRGWFTEFSAPEFLTERIVP